MKKLRKNSRKADCIYCGVSCGTYHKTHCPSAYALPKDIK